MIRFALIVASTLGFVLTAAMGNLMVPLLRAFQSRQQPTRPPEPERPDAAPGPDSDEAPERPAQPPTMGGLCLMVGVLAAVGVGWTAACVAEPQLLGTEGLLSTRLLIALFGALLFGGVGLADDLARIRRRAPLGLRRGTRLLLEAGAGAVVLLLLGGWPCRAWAMWSWAFWLRWSGKRALWRWPRASASRTASTACAAAPHLRPSWA